MIDQHMYIIITNIIQNTTSRYVYMYVHVLACTYTVVAGTLCEPTSKHVQDFMNQINKQYVCF